MVYYGSGSLRQMIKLIRVMITFCCIYVKMPNNAAPPATTADINSCIQRNRERQRGKVGYRVKQM